MKAGWRKGIVVVSAAGLLGLVAIGAWLYSKKRPAAAQLKPWQTYPAAAAAQAGDVATAGPSTAMAQARQDDDSRGASRPVDCTRLPYTSPTPLSPAAEAQQSEEDLRGGMDCQFSVGSGISAFTLHFLGRPDNTLGDIQVMQGGKVVQTITGHVIDLDALNPAGLDSAVQSVDANFDGYQDLELLNDCGATGNCDYDFYLYDPAQGRFVHNEFLSGLGTPEFHPAKKQVTTSWNSSAVDYSSSVYEFRDGDYIEIEREESDENGSRSYDRKDGKMVLRSTEKYDQ